MDRRLRSPRRFGPVAYDELSYLKALGLGGVVLPGELSWESFPRNSESTEVTSSGVANTDGSAQEMISSGDILSAYYVTHVVWTLDQSAIRVRWKIQEGATTRRVMRGVSREDTTDVPLLSKVSPPYLMAPASPMNLTLACDQINTTIPAYVQVMRGTPQLVPYHLKRAPIETQTVLEVGGESPTVNIVPGAWGDYSEDSTGFAAPILVTGVALIRNQNQDVRIALATGAAGEETDWGTFAVPNSTDGNKAQIFYDLWPWPLLVPPNTRLSSRVQFVDPIATPPAVLAGYLNYLVLS